MGRLAGHAEASDGKRRDLVDVDAVRAVEIELAEHHRDLRWRQAVRGAVEDNRGEHAAQKARATTGPSDEASDEAYQWRAGKTRNAG